jgi:alkanesulfonate monooxygenase SsuD/methylene tetrahydromethanopterin reductase-like flavin-dependent oxidoreductase (luciferase family)
MTQLEIAKTRVTEQIRLALVVIGARDTIADQIADIIASAIDTGHAIGYRDGYRDAGDYIRSAMIARDIPIETLGG